MRIKKFLKETAKISLVIGLILSMSVTVPAMSDTVGKYTISLSIMNYGSYHTFAGKMRVTSGSNSKEAIKIKIRRQSTNGDYSSWTTESSNNAVELVARLSEGNAIQYLGCQGKFTATSIGTASYFVKK